MNIVQNQDSGLSKFEYTVIMTSLIEIFFAILIPSLMGVNNILVIFIITVIVVVVNVFYWNIIRYRWKYLFE